MPIIAYSPEQRKEKTIMSKELRKKLNSMNSKELKYEIFSMVDKIDNTYLLELIYRTIINVTK